MAQLSQPRELRPAERAVIEFLLNADFAGRNELKEQLDCVEVVWECDCGCGTVNLRVKGSVGRAFTKEPIPVEANGHGLDVLLFVRGGFLRSLEILDHGDARPLSFPTVDSLTLRTSPAPKWNPPKPPEHSA
jgi:hypothetical protein